MRRRARACLHGVCGPIALLFAALVPSPGAATEITVVDDAGGTVSLTAPARRIVALTPHATELLFAAGAGPRVIGAANFSDYPPEARALPRVGDGHALDLEAIVRLKPDLAVAWASGSPRPQIERLRRLGIPVFLSEPRRLEDIAANLERLGGLAGTEPAANQAAQSFRARVAGLRARYAGRPSVRVFYQLWHHPIVTLNGRHLISDILILCGGRNVFADLPDLAPTVDEEAVLAADPDVIIASGMDARRPPWLDAWARWPGMRAVKKGRLLWVDPDVMNRSGPRVLEGVERVCGLLEAVR